MDMVKLNSAAQPSHPIENYDSLVWTERFNTVGDFVLVSGDIAGTMSMLPQGSRVSLQDSSAVMVVETHQIERKKNQLQKITVKGRSFESILDRRVAIKSLTDTSEWMVNVKTPSDVAYFMISQICNSGILDANDIFPTSLVSFPVHPQYLASTGPVKSFAIPRGNLLASVLQLLQTEAPADDTTSPLTPAVGQYGIRAERPYQSGLFTNTRISLYPGSDISSLLVFDASRDVFDDGSYLFSKVGSANTAYIIGQGVSAKMNESGVASGMDRRVILVDATTSGINDAAVLQQQGSMALATAQETALFDGSLNPDLSPFVYGSGIYSSNTNTYNLGDIVGLIGDYGLVQKARVTEYIRSEDSSGNKNYPTLTAITQ